MLRSLRFRFLLLLLAVVAIGLSSTLLLRELMLRDFDEYLEGESEDRVHWVTASLESSFDANGEWVLEDVVQSVLWANMLGIEASLLDARGTPLMDMELALQGLAPLVKKRVLATMRSRDHDTGKEPVPYALFWGGERIGTLQVRFHPPQREALFISRTDRFLAVSLVLLGGVAVLLSVYFAGWLTRPIKDLTAASARIGEGDLTGSRVPVTRTDELGSLSMAFNSMADTLALQEALRRKLTANVAHELRTPLSAMRGELEGMMDGLIPAKRENLQSIYAEVGRLTKTLDAIADLTQAEASGLRLQRRELELGPFLSDMADRYAALMSEKGVRLELDLAPGVRALADPDRLSQVLVNLLSNALRATLSGGLVTLRARMQGGETVLEVSDTGRGIEPGDLPFIFERFYHAADGGLGIGLAIVKELVEAHGGTIGCRSEPGEGATFLLRLPR